MLPNEYNFGRVDSDCLNSDRGCCNAIAHGVVVDGEK